MAKVLFAYVLNTILGETLMTEKALSYAFPVAVELTGIFILILGIAVEISTGADYGHVIISFGSAIIAVGSILWSKILKLKGKKG